MCIEDKQIGRELNVGVKYVASVLDGLTKLIPADPKRVVIGFSAGDNNRVRCIPAVMDIGTAGGFIISNVAPNLTLTIEEYGNLVTGAWRFNDDGTGSSVTVFFSTLERFE